VYAGAGSGASYTSRCSRDLRQIAYSANPAAAPIRMPYPIALDFDDIFCPPAWGKGS
jgi:hypothetical protein